MEPICWPYFDPEYETLSQRINPPRYANEKIRTTVENEKTRIISIRYYSKHDDRFPKPEPNKIKLLLWYVVGS